MKFNEKRAISEIVATVLIILITVAAIGIIWGAVMPMIKENMQSGQACLKAKLGIDTTSGYTCYNASSNTVFVVVTRGSETYNLTGIELIVSGGGNSTRKDFNASLPSENEARKYNITTTYSIDKAAVAPIIRIGATTKICDLSAEAVVSPCS